MQFPMAGAEELAEVRASRDRLTTYLRRYIYINFQKEHMTPVQGGSNDGKYPLQCCLMGSATRSRWGQCLGQEKETPENSSLCKTKLPEIIGVMFTGTQVDTVSCKGRTA